MIANEVDIGWRTQLSAETIPWADDLTAALDVGDVPASVTTTLIDLLTGVAYTAGLSGSPTVASNIVTQTVTALVAGHNYRLTFNTNVGGTKVKSSVVKLSCPY